MCSKAAQTLLSNDDVFPQAAYVFHTGRTFSLSFLNIRSSEELRMTSEDANLGVKRGTVSFWLL